MIPYSVSFSLKDRMIGPPLDYYAYAGLFNFVTTGLFTSYVISRKPELRLARLFCIFSAGVAIWSLFYFLSLKAPERGLSEFFLRTCMIPVAFLPSSFFHFVTELIEKKIPVWVHVLNYILSTIIALTIYTSIFAVGGAPQHLVFPYWLKPGPIFPVHVLHFVGVVIIAHMFLLKAIHESSGLRRAQRLMVFWGMLIAFASGTMNYLMWYRTPVPPILTPLVSMLVFAMGYAIVRHQLLDIKVVIRRSLVYSILITLLTVGYFGLIFVIERFFQTTLGYRSIRFSLSAFALMALFFQPLKIGVQRLVDQLFFRAPHEELVKRMERLEQEVRHADKLKAISTLAAGMAHEIKNPLTSLKTFAAYLPEKGSDPAFQQKFQQVVSREIDKIDQIVRRVLEFAKPASPQLHPVSVSRLLDETLDLLSNDALKRRVQVTRAYASTDTIEADAQQLRQVFLNLFLNSFESMNGSGGRLSVSTIQEGSRLAVQIEDSGHGISKEHLQHVFDPFFTTKPDGTGLGLSVVRGIVTEHGGTISFNSPPGRGTTCTLTFPLLR